MTFVNLLPYWGGCDLDLDLNSLNSLSPNSPWLWPDSRIWLVKSSWSHAIFHTPLTMALTFNHYMLTLWPWPHFNWSHDLDLNFADPMTLTSFQTPSEMAVEVEPEAAAAEEHLQQPRSPEVVVTRSPMHRLTPERMKQLGLPEGMDLRNTDV